MFAAPGQKLEFDAAPSEVVEDLIGGAGVAALQREQLLHVVDIEIADAEIADLAVGEQRLEAGKRLLERLASRANAGGRDRCGRS